MAAQPESVAAEPTMAIESVSVADVAAGPSLIKTGCSSGGDARARPGYYSPNGFIPGSSQNHNNASELFLRDLEIEKMRIRELLLVADNAHRQVMEAGFRIELLLERQMALMRSNHFSSVSAPLTLCYPGLSSVRPCAVRFAKDRLENGESAVPMLRPTNSKGKCVSLSGGAEHENLYDGEFIEVAETDGFHAEKASTDEKQTNNTSPKIAVTNLNNNLKQNADELQEEARDGNGWSLLKSTRESAKENGHPPSNLARPLENVFGAKRKADTQPPEVGAVSKIPSTGAKKKLKQEFSCELCQVVVSSEQVFNGHLRGNKHKKAAARREKFALGLAPKMTQHADDSKKETLDKKDLALKVAQKSNDSEEKNGNFAEMVSKIGDGNKNCMLEFNLDKVGAHTEKVMDDEKKREMHLRKPLEVGSKGGFQLEKVTCMEKETNSGTKNISNPVQDEESKEESEETKEFSLQLTQNIYDSAKGNGSSKDTMMKTEDGNGYVSNSYDNSLMLAVTQKSSDPVKGNGSRTDTALRTGDKNKKFKFSCKICKVGSNDEKVMNTHFRGKRHSDKLINVAQIGGSQVKYASTEVKETKETSHQLDVTPKGCNLEQARPLENVFGAKRKADTHPLEVGVVSKIPSTGAKEKLEQEFSCELCQVTQHADDLKKETLDKKDLALQVAQKSNDSKEENGNFAEMVSKIGDGDENCKLAFNLDKVGAHTEKVMDDEKKREMHLRKPLEDGSRGGFQAEKATSMEKETNSGTKNNSNLVQIDDESKEESEETNEFALQLTQNSYDSMKGNGSSTDTLMKTEDGNGYVSNSCDNSLMLAVTQNTSDSDTGNRSSTNTAFRTGDKNKKFQFSCKICKVGSNDEKAMNTHFRGKRDSDKLINVAQNGGLQVKYASTEEKETKGISHQVDVALKGCNLEQARSLDNVSGAKHKADTQPPEVGAVSKIPSTGAKKKLKQEFSCELCQVVVSSEQVFNGHLQGKKHKKAAARREKFALGLVPKRKLWEEMLFQLTLNTCKPAKDSSNSAEKLKIGDEN